MKVLRQEPVLLGGIKVCIPYTLHSTFSLEFSCDTNSSIIQQPYLLSRFQTRHDQPDETASAARRHQDHARECSQI